MNTKIWNITGWVLSALVSLLLIASALDKIGASAHSLEMTRSFAISPDIYRLLGIIELISAIFFMIPKTSLLGLLLLSSYLGGAIATHLQHDQSIIFPAAIEALVWIAAAIRFRWLFQQPKNRPA